MILQTMVLVGAFMLQRKRETGEKEEKEEGEQREKVELEDMKGRVKLVIVHLDLITTRSLGTFMLFYDFKGLILIDPLPWDLRVIFP